MSDAHSSPLLAGVDVGTSSCKAGVLRPDGALLALARRPTPPLDGPADAVAAAVLAALTDATAAASEGAGDAAGERVAAVGVAGMAETGVPLDADLRPLGPLVPWTDRRAADDADALAARLGAPALYAVTGLTPDANRPLATWCRLRRTAPEALERMRVWAHAVELVAHALTGVLATEASLAARTMAYDVTRRRWDADLLAEAGLDPSRLPPVLPPGKPVGTLSAAAAAATGLRRGIPVTLAGHDHAVGAHAAGVRSPGDLAVSLGTAEAVLTLADRLPEPTAGLASGFTVGCHVDGRSRYLIGGLPRAGDALRWLAGLLVPAVDPAQRMCALAGLAGSAAPGPTGLVVEPYLAGRAAPRPDPGRRLAVHGVSDAHGPAHLAKGLLEGLSCHGRWMVDALGDLTGTSARTLLVYGGGTRLPSRVRLTAALAAAPVALADVEAVVVGAALLAAPAAGIVTRPSPAVPAVDLAGAEDAFRDDYRSLYADRFLPAVTEPAGSVLPPR